MNEPIGQKDGFVSFRRFAIGNELLEQIAMNCLAKTQLRRESAIPATSLLRFIEVKGRVPGGVDPFRRPSSPNTRPACRKRSCCKPNCTSFTNWRNSRRHCRTQTQKSRSRKRRTRNENDRLPQKTHRTDMGLAGERPRFDTRLVDLEGGPLPYLAVNSHMPTTLLNDAMNPPSFASRKASRRVFDVAAGSPPDGYEFACTAL